MVAETRARHRVQPPPGGEKIALWVAANELVAFHEATPVWQETVFTSGQMRGHDGQCTVLSLAASFSWVRSDQKSFAESPLQRVYHLCNDKTTLSSDLCDHMLSSKLALASIIDRKNA